MKAHWAPIISSDHLDSAVTIADGEPIIVYGITLSNHAGVSSVTVITMTNAADTINYMVSRFGANDSVHIPICFYADQGLRFEAVSGSPEDIHVTVYHSHPGM
jgi:hypothetical protein